MVVDTGGIQGFTRKTAAELLLTYIDAIVRVRPSGNHRVPTGGHDKLLIGGDIGGCIARIPADTCDCPFQDSDVWMTFPMHIFPINAFTNHNVLLYPDVSG